MKFIKFVFLVCISFFGFSEVFSVQSADSEFDNLLNNSQSADSSTRSQWQIFGYLESENFFALKPANEHFIKLEERIRSTARYGTPFYYSLLTMDLYTFPVKNKWAPPRTEGIPQIYEMYVAAGEKLQVKAGKMVFNWGKADAFKITNYLDQRDIRELFSVEEDERYIGRTAFSLKYNFSDFSLEAVYAPYVDPVIFPDQNSFWNFHLENTGAISPVFHPEYGSGDTLKNASMAVRAGGSSGDLDAHISFYHGISPDVSFFPVTALALPTMNVASIDLYPEEYRISKAGLEFAWALGKLATRLESVYTFDKKVLVKEKTDQEVIGMSATHIMTRQRALRTGALAYTAGMDYTLWGNFGKILVEYTSSYYFPHESDSEKDFFSDFVLVRLEDRWFDERLRISTGAALKTKGEIGGVPNVSLEWDFKNGMTATLGGMVFTGSSNQFIKLYEDHDFFYFRMRMTY